MKYLSLIIAAVAFVFTAQTSYAQSTKNSSGDVTQKKVVKKQAAPNKAVKKAVAAPATKHQSNGTQNKPTTKKIKTPAEMAKQPVKRVEAPQSKKAVREEEAPK